jgi:NADPH-dependent F420 reductase
VAHTIAIVGGTGPQGRGLASRFVRAGHEVLIGSREASKATTVVEELRSSDGLRDDPEAQGRLVAGSNTEVVASDAAVVVVATPFDGLEATVRSLADALARRVVVSCVNPLRFDERGPTPRSVPQGSAAELVAALAPDAAVVAAFHHLSAPTLLEVGPPHDESVLLCGDDQASKDLVAELADATAARGAVDAGPLRNARILEDMTAVLIAVNKRYKARSGLAVTGLPGR